MSFINDNYFRVAKEDDDWHIKGKDGKVFYKANAQVISIYMDQIAELMSKAYSKGTKVVPRYKRKKK
jgi:predicted NAD/FAD-dependent oxidoreductase